MSKKNKIRSRETSNTKAYLFLAPYLLLFTVFILIPVAIAIGLSFTNFNTIQAPSFTAFMNYINLITQDEVFMQFVLPNTVTYALIVGPGGYVLSFLLAWGLAQLTKGVRTVLALILYSPSITSGVAMVVLWRILFNGDQTGYINAWLIRIGVITEPIKWLINANFLLPIMIIVALWSSMGVGFLAILAGILNSDETLYEAAAIDGVRNRFQEMIYITIPTMKPQMLFAAVMTIVGAFQNGMIGVQLAGANPTPGYAGQLIVNHIEDYGFIRYEMGYAAAVSVVLLGIVYLFSSVSKRFFKED
ncbi:multiple sugar transport system permease protein [Anaerotaenia torta]|uniref:carbohydrate ABC transporter permease n=1 Tax=Anaerotaenia torta TaxID=433293 RepID=UPI003D1E4E52